MHYSGLVFLSDKSQGFLSEVLDRYDYDREVEPQIYTSAAVIVNQASEAVEHLKRSRENLLKNAPLKISRAALLETDNMFNKYNNFNTPDDLIDYAKDHIYPDDAYIYLIDFHR